MLIRHFDELRPVCPACRAAGREAQPLVLRSVFRRDGEDVREGILVCPVAECQREHPVVDGIPIVVADFRGWAQHQLDAVLRRDDLAPETESLLGDAAGPDSIFERDRNTAATYILGHWGDHRTPDPVGGDETIAGLVDEAFGLHGQRVDGAWIDLGCSAGRGTFEAAERGAALAVGVDLSFGPLKAAETLRRSGGLTYRQRRVGIVYDPAQVTVEVARAERISFWCCDAQVLPFPEATFDGALSLNLLDSIASPFAHLMEMGRVLRPGGAALLCSPYDWAGAATPLEQWIGGHSQRGPGSGSSAEALRRLLSGGGGMDAGLRIEAEREDVAWRLRMHERAVVEYRVHLLKLHRPCP